MFLREQANKMYKVRPYFFGKMLLEIPALVLQPLLWAVVTYFGVGLTDDAG